MPALQAVVHFWLAFAEIWRAAQAGDLPTTSGVGEERGERLTFPWIRFILCKATLQFCATHDD